MYPIVKICQVAVENCRTDLIFRNRESGHLFQFTLLGAVGIPVTPAHSVHHDSAALVT